VLLLQAVPASQAHFRTVCAGPPCPPAGFTDAFWRGYHSVLPKAPLFDQRRPLYQLYHYLNHYNLFGGGYYNTSARILEQLVAKL